MEEVKNMSSKVIKIIGIVATIGGMAASLATDWVNDKKMDEKIAEKVTEILKNTTETVES